MFTSRRLGSVNYYYRRPRSIRVEWYRWRVRARISVPILVASRVRPLTVISHWTDRFNVFVRVGFFSSRWTNIRIDTFFEHTQTYIEPEFRSSSNVVRIKYLIKFTRMNGLAYTAVRRTKKRPRSVLFVSKNYGFSWACLRTRRNALFVIGTLTNKPWTYFESKSKVMREQKSTFYKSLSWFSSWKLAHQISSGCFGQ